MPPKRPGRGRGRGKQGQGQQHSGQAQGPGQQSSGQAPAGPPVSSGIQAQSSSSSGHKKTNSAELKKKKMRESLGSAPGGESSRAASGPPSKTHLLLVQGSRHGALISDFIKLVDFFEKKVNPGFSADFWTCFGPEEWFQSKKGVDYDTIKFGGEVIANRRACELYPYSGSYKYVDENTLCQKVYQWIDWKADPTDPRRANPGDSIIIILLAHGVWRELPVTIPLGMRIGRNDMLVADFVAALRKIPRNVQVNVLSNACYSAIFAQHIEEDGQTERWIQVASQPLDQAFATVRSASNRFANSTFVAELVKSLAGLGKNNHIALEQFQDNLKTALEASETPSTPLSYHYAPLTTQVHSLLLRSFADFPFTPQNSAARRQQELNIGMLNRPFPDSAATGEKKRFAASLILEERESFGEQPVLMKEEEFAEAPRNQRLRETFAKDLLRGMLIRGRYQAAVFDVFMQLCLQGACSLESLRWPVNHDKRPAPDSCHGWIRSMLSLFDCFRIDWDELQEKWQIDPEVRWVDYDAPLIWLSTMIARSFTSLDRVYDIILTKQQFGSVDKDLFDILVKKPTDPSWKPDPRCNEGTRGSGKSGTFAFWLPDGIDKTLTQGPFEDAAIELSQTFYARLGRTEEVYQSFFDIDRAEFSPQDQEDFDIRDWVADVNRWASHPII